MKALVLTFLLFVTIGVAFFVKTSHVSDAVIVCYEKVESKTYYINIKKRRGEWIGAEYCKQERDAIVKYIDCLRDVRVTYANIPSNLLDLTFLAAQIIKPTIKTENNLVTQHNNSCAEYAAIF